MGRRDFQTPDRQTLRGTCVEAKQNVPAWIRSRRPLAVPLTATRWAVPACGSLEICAPPAALPPRESHLNERFYLRSSGRGTQARVTIVGERLFDFLAGVHHERTILHHRLA